MATLLPTFPRIVFSQLEPLSVVAGFLAPVISPEFFIGSQLPPASLSVAQQTILSGIVVHDPTTKLISWQLGNCYLLLGLLGVFILNTTTEVKVVQAYLLALWLGDIGHVGFTLYAMGLDGIKDVAGWNPLVWANIVFTLFLFIVRSLYFQGVFDEKVPAPPPAASTRARAKSKSKSK